MKSFSTAMPVYGTGTRPSAFAPAATSFERPAIVEMRRERVHAGIAVRGTGDLCPQSAATGVFTRDVLPTPFPGTNVWSGAPA